jgi:hypothetical protein
MGVREAIDMRLTTPILLPSGTLVFTSACGVPRFRIMHACAHEISWLLPTNQSLQQKPAAAHSCLQVSESSNSAMAAASKRS